LWKKCFVAIEESMKLAEVLVRGMPAVSQSWLILGKNQAYQGDLNAARLSLNEALALTQDADNVTQAQEKLANIHLTISA